MNSQNIKNILAASAFALAGLLPANAEVLLGRIVDANTKQPIEDVDIQVNCIQYIEGLCSTAFVFKAKTDSVGVFKIYVEEGKVTMNMNCIGYRGVSRNLYSVGSKDTIRLGDIKMKFSEILLKYAEVKGHAKRFFLRGDTVIFNPKAFHLEEGARLDELIKKLDGVRVEKGKLTWMGKPLRLLVDGEELFGDNNLLIGRLPAAAVDKIKAYNKASESSQRTGRDDGAEDRVLDIKVKPGWLDRWYGDGEAGIQNKARYTASLDAYRLSKSNPMMLFLKANNVNESTFERSFGSASWGPIGNFGKEQFGSAGYKHQWDSKYGKKHSTNNFWFNFMGGHDDAIWNNHSSTETFLPGTSHSYTLTGDENRTCSVTPKFSLGWRVDIDSMTAFNIFAKVNYDKVTSNGTNLSATFAQSPYELDSDPLNNAFDSRSSMLNAQLINSRNERSLGDTEGGAINIQPWLSHHFKDKSAVTISNSFSYENSRGLNFLHRDLRYYDASAQNSFQNIYSRSPKNTLSNTMSLGYKK